MARSSLIRNRKFVELAHVLRSEALAMGHLELLWQAQYELGDAVIGSAAVLEHHACWRGKRSVLALTPVSFGTGP